MNEVDETIVQDTDPAAGVPGGGATATDSPDADTTGSATPVATPKTEDAHPEVMDALPSISRGKDEELKVDDNFNLDYVLKNGKKLKISVVKPDLEVSTKLSDAQIRINETDDGDRYMTVNNLGVYKMILSDVVRVVTTDGAPIHAATFQNLSKIGMTKSELDDVMSIIVTFYLQN
ncbi:hypothetical protein [Levilactobacillus namurensis]|uniref:hypothetical protein n=1 Tax=Levilactobacillus namurensis TaxID=380393 RepID=UPI0026ECE34B|nr:hypothetical protein [Levilactobacillus namurensis]